MNWILLTLLIVLVFVLTTPSVYDGIAKWMEAKADKEIEAWKAADEGEQSDE